MKINACLSVLSLLLLVVGLQTRAFGDELTDARARFTDGEFDQAAKLFEQALEKSPPSAAVFYELGRSLVKAGQEPRAALNFRRSLILDPRFAPARTALQETNIALGIAPPKPDWQTKILERVPMKALTLAGVILFWVGGFTGLAAFFFQKKRGRRLTLGFAMVFVGVGLLAVVWFCDPLITMSNTAMVLTNGGSSLLRSPTDQAEKVTSLPQGSLIEVLSQRGRWFYGALPASGVRGWFLTEGIVPLIPPA